MGLLDIEQKHRDVTVMAGDNGTTVQLKNGATLTVDKAEAVTIFDHGQAYSNAFGNTEIGKIDFSSIERIASAGRTLRHHGTLTDPQIDELGAMAQTIIHNVQHPKKDQTPPR